MGVWVRAGKSQGSVFHVTVPFEAYLQQEEKIINYVNKCRCNQQIYSILVAEDNIINQKFINTILSKMGHKVVCCNDGEQAVEEWRIW